MDRESTIYNAIVGVCEAIERGERAVGNGHHLAQELAGFAETAIAAREDTAPAAPPVGPRPEREVSCACGWRGLESRLIFRHSASPNGCPECGVSGGLTFAAPPVRPQPETRQAFGAALLEWQRAHVTSRCGNPRYRFSDSMLLCNCGANKRVEMPGTETRPVRHACNCDGGCQGDGLFCPTCPGCADAAPPQQRDGAKPREAYDPDPLMAISEMADEERGKKQPHDDGRATCCEDGRTWIAWRGDGRNWTMCHSPNLPPCLVACPFCGARLLPETRAPERADVAAVLAWCDDCETSTRFQNSRMSAIDIKSHVQALAAEADRLRADRDRGRQVARRIIQVLDAHSSDVHVNGDLADWVLAWSTRLRAEVTRLHVERETMRVQLADAQATIDEERRADARAMMVTNAEIERLRADLKTCSEQFTDADGERVRLRADLARRDAMAKDSLRWWREVQARHLGSCESDDRFYAGTVEAIERLVKAMDALVIEPVSASAPAAPETREQAPSSVRLGDEVCVNCRKPTAEIHVEWNHDKYGSHKMHVSDECCGIVSRYVLCNVCGNPTMGTGTGDAERGYVCGRCSRAVEEPAPAPTSDADRAYAQIPKCTGCRTPLDPIQYERGTCRTCAEKPTDGTGTGEVKP